jgi:protein-S-isoprenylcysteine O-methyltransferase Ste14
MKLVSRECARAAPGLSSPLRLAEERFLGRTRLVLFYVLLATLLAFAKPTPLGVTIGFSIAALGEILRFWAAGHLFKTKELVTSGPYRYTRNPLYLGRLLIFTGICVMAALPYGMHWVVMLVGYVVFFTYYLPRKERVEPARLLAAHGDAYARYKLAVPAFFPTFRPFPAGSSAGWSSDRMFRNREHWMVLGLLAVTLFLLWRAYAAPGPHT